MQRRKLLKRSLILGSAGLIGGSSVWLMNGYDVNKLTIEQATADLQDLYLTPTQIAGGWNLSQIFNHLAQSVEYSMTGYPELHSENFRNTVGYSAFSVFALRGKMSHDLVEPIPGAPALGAGDKPLAFSRLLTALNNFKLHQGPLKPHFAYGELSHQQYTQAHVMHINNHLETMA